jgi:heptosyltransferase-1
MHGKPGNGHILVVRLGALGDIIHTLPAVASLKHSFPGWRLSWAVEPKWTPLLEENPFVDRIVPVRRDSLRAILASRRELRAERYDFAVDFQGLLKSAMAASMSHPGRIYGFHQSQTRERIAGLFYSDKTMATTTHVVDRNLELAAAAGAVSALKLFPLPPGRPEGKLPEGDFVLASPLAGWASKQWPPEHFRALGELTRQELGMPLVLNGPPGCGLDHLSGLPGLIDATRRAAAVVGVDSGPMHIAAALGRPGVAIFGPTDPARNGPYGDSVRILRSASASTTYKRDAAISASMRSITPAAVFEALKAVLGKCLV